MKKRPPKFILIARYASKPEWNTVIAPPQSEFTQAYPILSNDFNEYVEWANCGVIYRVIRGKDLDKYELGGKK